MEMCLWQINEMRREKTYVRNSHQSFRICCCCTFDNNVRYK